MVSSVEACANLSLPGRYIKKKKPPKLSIETFLLVATPELLLTVTCKRATKAPGTRCDYKEMSLGKILSLEEMTSKNGLLGLGTGCNEFQSPALWGWDGS